VSGLKAVIFDWAGTTVDTGSRAPVQAMIEALGDFGVEVAGEDVRRDMGLGKRDHVARLLALPQVAARWQARRGALPDERAADRVYEALLRHQIQRIAALSPVIDGVPGAVAALRARGLKIGSCSGYPRAILAAVAAGAARAGYAPDCSVATDEVPRGRPYPDMALQAMRLLGIADPAACVKVDDTPAGIEEGRNAGMWAVGVAGTGSEVGLSAGELRDLGAVDLAARVAAAADRLRAAGAHYVVDGVSAFVPVVDTIGARLRLGERP
jgi:phosphonoacetaldehyde hydrolase